MMGFYYYEHTQKHKYKTRARIYYLAFHVHSIHYNFNGPCNAKHKQYKTTNAHQTSNY